MLFLGGVQLKWFALGGIAVGLFAFIYLKTQGYAGSRITAWRDPASDPTDNGYQILQSLYAIGSGGLMGLGLGKSRQKYLYLPEEHNDYIFPILCEELGFVGAVVVILLFILLIVRGYYIAMHARDRFGALLAARGSPRILRCRPSSTSASSRISSRPPAFRSRSSPMAARRCSCSCLRPVSSWPCPGRTTINSCKAKRESL